MTERIGEGGYFNRALYAAHLESVGTRLAPTPLLGDHFSVLLVADAVVDLDGYGRLLALLGERGASWFACWGPGAARAPEIVYSREFQSSWHITCTWWERDLSEAIQAFLWSSAPDESTHDECRSGLVLSVGELVEPGELRSLVLEELSA